MKIEKTVRVLHTQIAIHLPTYISFPMSIYNNRSKANDCNLEIVWWMFDKYYRQQPHYKWAGKKMGIIVTLTNDQLLA